MWRCFIDERDHFSCATELSRRELSQAMEREISIVMRTDKSNSRVSARLLYRTPDNRPYDVAVLQVVNLRDVDPSLEAMQLSRAPILKGE